MDFQLHVTFQTNHIVTTPIVQQNRQIVVYTFLHQSQIAPLFFRWIDIQVLHFHRLKDALPTPRDKSTLVRICEEEE